MWPIQFYLSDTLKLRRVRIQCGKIISDSHYTEKINIQVDYTSECEENMGEYLQRFGCGKIFKEKTKFTKYKQVIIKLDYSNIKNFLF